MLESYQHEIQRKRRAARVFWCIVFAFALFLFFFFQGYYPSPRTFMSVFFSEKTAS
jgi:cell shape-determining protein MreC